MPHTLALLPADASTDALALVVWLGAIAAVLLLAAGVVEGLARRRSLIGALRFFWHSYLRLRQNVCPTCGRVAPVSHTEWWSNEPGWLDGEGHWRCCGHDGVSELHQRDVTS